MQLAVGDANRQELSLSVAFLIVDTETSGLDPKADHLVEVGAVLFDADLASIVEVRSVLVRATSNAAEKVNGIPEVLLALPWCTTAEGAHRMLQQMYDRGQRVHGECYVLAHNAEFDRQWFPDVGWRWVCTCDDADWPRHPRGTGSLVSIALAYGVGVSRAHRAIEDCLTLAATLARVHEVEGHLDDWLKRALEPRMQLRALVSFDNNQLAKDAGFRWQPDAKEWTKKVRVSQARAFTSSLPFKTVEIKDVPGTDQPPPGSGPAPTGSDAGDTQERAEEPRG